MKKWIARGKLRGFRTPGGHFRIAADEFQHLRNAYGFSEQAGESSRILVVDDDPGMVSLVSDALRGIRPPLKLEAAFDGYEGILKVGTFRPHLLLLDLRMPGVDGFEVCHRIKSDPVTRPTRILAITAYPEDAAKEKASQCGADAFLAKPFTIKELKGQVKRLLKRKASR